MTFTEVIIGIVVQTTANIISNLSWFILIIWSVKSIGREINKGIKKVPEWLEQYEKIKKEQRAIDYAVRGLRD